MSHKFGATCHNYPSINVIRYMDNKTFQGHSVLKVRDLDTISAPSLFRSVYLTGAGSGLVF